MQLGPGERCELPHQVREEPGRQITNSFRYAVDSHCCYASLQVSAPVVKNVSGTLSSSKKLRGNHVPSPVPRWLRHRFWHVYCGRTCLFLARVKLMSGNFVDALITDEKLRDIKVVFITALCSKSGVANPVSFVVTEGEGMKSAVWCSVI